MSSAGKRGRDSSDGKSSHGVHSKNSKSSDTQRASSGVNVGMKKGQRVPTDESRQLSPAGDDNETIIEDEGYIQRRGGDEDVGVAVSKAMKAFKILEDVAHNDSSALKPILDSLSEKSPEEMVFLKKLNNMEKMVLQQRKDASQQMRSLEDTRAIRKRELDELLRKAELVYDRSREDAERRKELAIQEENERHNRKLERIKSNFNEALSNLASAKHKALQVVEDDRIGDFKKIDLVRNEHKNTLKVIDAKLKKLKKNKAEVILSTCFGDQHLSVFKAITDAFKLEVSHSSTHDESELREEIEPKGTLRIEEIHEDEPPVVLSELELRQQRREQERKLRDSQPVDLDIVSQNEKDPYSNMGIRAHSSFLTDQTFDMDEPTQLSPRKARRASVRSKPPPKKQTNRELPTKERKSRERPSFLRKPARDKRFPKKRVEKPGESSSSPDEVAKKKSLEDSDDMEYVGGGVHASVFPQEEGVEGEVGELVRRVREANEGDSQRKIDEIKRARLEKALASCRPVKSADLQSITSTSKAGVTDDMLSKSLEALNFEVPEALASPKHSDSFGQVLGAVVPYTGPVHSNTQDYIPYLYQESDSDGSGSSEYSYDEDEDLSSSDDEGWGRRGARRRRPSLSNVFKQVGAGNIEGTGYEGLTESMKNYKSKVRADYFQRHPLSTHGIAVEPRLANIPGGKRGGYKKRKTKDRYGKKHTGRKGGKRATKARRKNEKSGDLTMAIFGGELTSEQIRNAPDVYLDGIQYGRVTREDDKNPGCPLRLADGSIPSEYAIQFTDLHSTGPFPYYTASMIDRCGYCGYLLSNCKCTCFLGHTRSECLNECVRGFHFTYQMARSYTELLRGITTGDEQTIRDAWQEWRKYRRDKLPENMETLESAFIRTFRWADKNGNLWRAGGVDEGEEDTDSPFQSMGNMLALMNEPYDETTMGKIVPPPTFDVDDPGRVMHPHIHNVWYSKSCGTLNDRNIPTTKPPCHICGWPSIRKKNDSFTFCSSCRNCQKVRTWFEQWSKQSGVRGSNRGRKKAKNNLPQRRGARKKIESTRLEPGSVMPLAISAPPTYGFGQPAPSIDPSTMSRYPAIPMPYVPPPSRQRSSVATTAESQLAISLPLLLDTPEYSLGFDDIMDQDSMGFAGQSLFSDLSEDTLRQLIE